ncbi:serine threonine kinase [Fusarium albosuccineum]|uniref:Serine threonine kinase n=1 Tax=Fusarium albosuccineum TaxID=1237068 RepID=A0A8H4L1V2_9HYPO|nr:serine threonine kinase [Fusarium albosuccineum]
MVLFFSAGLCLDMASPPHTGSLLEENIVLRQILGYRLETVETSLYNLPQIGQCLPGTFIKDVLLVSIDVDAKDYEAISADHDFRIGVSILDTRYLVQKLHDPRDTITSYQFINRNSETCNNAAKNFLFRELKETELITLEPGEASQSSVQLAPPTFASRISSLIKDRDYVLLAHGTHAEVKFLNNIDPGIIDRALYVLDTAMAAQFPLKQSRCHKLCELLDKFGIRYALLHTAGNDAHFALKALLMIAVRDSRLVPETAAPGDEDLFRYLDAVAHAPCNLSVWTEAPPLAKAKGRRRRERDANRLAFQELPFADEPPADPSIDEWQRQIQAYYKTLALGGVSKRGNRVSRARRQLPFELCSLGGCLNVQSPWVLCHQACKPLHFSCSLAFDTASPYRRLAGTDQDGGALGHGHRLISLTCGQHSVGGKLYETTPPSPLPPARSPFSRISGCIDLAIDGQIISYRAYGFAVYACAIPAIDAPGGPPQGQQVTSRRIFFSKGRLREHFGSNTTIDALLACLCNRCTGSFNAHGFAPLDESHIQEKILSGPDGPLFLALMVYLGTLHLVYPWFSFGFYTRDLRSATTSLLGQVATLFEPGLERNLFQNACAEALEKFDPVKLDFSINTIIPHTTYSDISVFPFCEEVDIGQGTFGTMRRFEIHRESLHHSAEERMRDYPSSVAGWGSERRLLFVRKSVEVTPRHVPSMERDILRMVSQIRGAAADNIVTLLTCYTWQGQWHFVFPYIETDLARLLQGGVLLQGLSPHLRDDEFLPDNWLWKQILGVCRALAVMHTGMRNPFGHMTGQVIMFHFDLKPANILVTADGTLKIADFGLSSITIVQQGQAQTAAYRQGDMRYAPPESRNTGTSDTLPGGELGDIGVLLNYDVWSLACIMTEVLVRLLSQEGHSNQHEGSATLPREGRFFNDNDGILKDCVRNLINGIKCMFREDPSYNTYMKAVGDLLLEMFNHDNSQRISSSTVLDHLERANINYDERRSYDRDELALELLQSSRSEARDYREVGWDDGCGVTQSFLSM